MIQIFFLYFTSLWAGRGFLIFIFPFQLLILELKLNLVDSSIISPLTVWRGPSVECSFTILAVLLKMRSPIFYCKVVKFQIYNLFFYLKKTGHWMADSVVILSQVSPPTWNNKLIWNRAIIKEHFDPGRI